MVCKILSPWSDERAGTPKSVAQIAVAHFSILQSPTPADCGTATSATARGGTRGAETLRVWAAGVENILRERHARVGPGADVDPPHYSKLSGF
jgi:hypothetical protein